MKVKHTLREKLLFKYKWEEHPSNVAGHIEVWEQSRPRLWWLILLTPLIVVLSPIIMLITYIIIIGQLIKYDNTYEVYTMKKDEGQDNESNV